MSEISICGKFILSKKLRTGTKNNKTEIKFEFLSLNIINYKTFNNLDNDAKIP